MKYVMIQILTVLSIATVALLIVRAVVGQWDVLRARSHGCPCSKVDGKWWPRGDCTYHKKLFKKLG